MYFCTFDEVKKHIKDINKVFCYIENPKTFMVQLFPYYTDSKDGNIAKYARGKDYHVVVKQMLENQITELIKKHPNNKFISFCDISPLPEVYIAYKSGAGILGKNGLIFDEKYGSYVFIGIILTDLEIKFEKVDPKNCCNCGICVEKCPQKAISCEKIIEEKCLSYITQKSGEIADTEIIEKAQYIWGCDICMYVCPMNRNVEKTMINDFKTDLIYDLNIKNVANLTRKEFVSSFPDRAFTFKGPKPIERNLSIKLKILTNMEKNVD